MITVLDVTGAGRPLFTGACVKVENSADNSTQFEDACHFTRLLITDDPAYAPLAFLSATSDLRSLSGACEPSGTQAPVALTGSFGSFDPPTVLSAVAADADNADPTWSAGDTITVTFDRPTNQPGEFLDADELATTLIHSSDFLGDEYAAHWAAADTLVITAVAVESAYPPRIDITRISVRTGAFNITNAAGTSVGCTDSTTLRGSFGATVAPQLLSVTVEDVRRTFPSHSLARACPEL